MSYKCSVTGYYRCTGEETLKDMTGTGFPGFSEPCEHAYRNMEIRALNQCRSFGRDLDQIVCSCCDCGPSSDCCLDVKRERVAA